jgi:hypothetical protein
MRLPSRNREDCGMPTRDVHARPIMGAGAAIAVCVIGVVVAVFLLLRYWQVPVGADRVRKIDLPAGAAILQSAPQVERAQYREQERKRLESSGWVDAANGIARIPIEDAFDILAPRPPASSPALQVRP